MGARKRKLRKTKADWTVTDWEKWLWKIFSQYIRLRDCIKSLGAVDRGKCVTCGRIYPFKKLQAGHFVPGRTRAVLFDERCVHAQCFLCNMKPDHTDVVLFDDSDTHAQCYRCNHKLSGAWPAYYRFMQQEYGQAVVEELIDNYGVDCKLTPEWFEQSYKYYEWCVSEMRRTGALVED